MLELNNGNRTKTARDLGVDPRTIFRHLEKEDDGEGEVPDDGARRLRSALTWLSECHGVDAA